MPVEIKDRGWNIFKRQVISMDRSFSKVGFPKEASPESGNKKGSGHKEASTMADIATIASFLEFGTEHIPSYNFMKKSFDENIEGLVKIRNNLYRKITSGQMSFETGLSALGEYMTAKTKKMIRDIKTPKNKPVTIKRKGSDNPLIDTAQMLQSVTHVEEYR